jgi:hypothetical protein
VGAVLFGLIARELLLEHVALKDVVAHRREAPAGAVGHLGRVLGLLDEGDHAALFVGVDHAEGRGFFLRDGDRSDGEVCVFHQVVLQHLLDVHLVDVVAAEDDDDLGVFVAHDVKALPDRVGAAAKPVEPRALLGGDRLDVVVEDRREPPGARDVLFERGALVLREDLDLREAAVDEVREDHVDDAIAAAEGDRGLGSLERERRESLALTPSENHRENTRKRPSRADDLHRSRRYQSSL